MLFLRAVQFWIILSTLASVAGWTLSALGVLNKTGYGIFAAIVVGIVFAFRKSFLFSPSASVQAGRKLRRRFLRFLPAAFASLAALVFISGCLYAPTDHTGLSYRLPRVLQWLQHGSWFWIHTANYRMNDRACGIEWLSAPLLLFLKSDRLLFLLNFIPFILMPGLIFSIWTRIGVRPRVAWNWMWLVPTGYCFLLQAGGIANYAFPTVYALAMMDFALRARDKCRGGGGMAGLGPWTLDFGLSVLSAALLVGAKASNLPLGLPWVIVIFPLIPKLFRRRDPALNSAPSTFDVRRSVFDIFGWSFLLFIALLVSFIPTALLNIHYIHDWSGLSIERSGMNMKNPIAGILGNALLLVTNNFVPTFFPMAHWWNLHALTLLPQGLVRLMNANFEEGYELLGEMPTEDSSGIGFGVSMLVVISVVAGWLAFRNSKPGTRNSEPQSRFAHHASRLILIAPWLSLLAYCMKTGMVTPGRLITPYYPLLFPLLLIGAGQGRLVRRHWWRVAAGIVFALALAALVATPARPLWPAKTILAKAVALHPNQPQLLRAQKVYEVYGYRADPLACVRQWFPPGLKTIGFLGRGDDLDISLWKPYGSRRVEPLLIDDPPETIRKLGIEYAVVSGLQLETENTKLEDWLQRSDATVIATTNVIVTVGMGPQAWYVVRFKP